MIRCYVTPGKRKAAVLADAFAKGVGGKIMAEGAAYQCGPTFFYGMTDYTFGIRRACIGAGCDWYYADNAYYFGRGAYFRVTRNDWQTNGLGRAGPQRFQRFNLKVKPWRTEGYILIATQSDLFYRMFEGVNRQQWVDRVTAVIRRHTDRPIKVAWKPEPHEKGMFPHGPFEKLVKGAFALVTHSSSCAVGAIISGVPVFTTASCCADPVSSGALENIEAPYYPDGREQWLWNLAASQWTREEMRSGKCWRDLQEAAFERA